MKTPQQEHLWLWEKTGEELGFTWKGLARAQCLKRILPIERKLQLLCHRDNLQVISQYGRERRKAFFLLMPLATKTSYSTVTSGSRTAKSAECCPPALTMTPLNPLYCLLLTSVGVSTASSSPSPS